MSETADTFLEAHDDDATRRERGYWTGRDVRPEPAITMGSLEHAVIVAPVGRSRIERLMAAPVAGKRRHARPLSLWDFFYSHPGAQRRQSALVVGYACRQCGEWVDRLAAGGPLRGRLPKFCSPRCRVRAFRAA